MQLISADYIFPISEPPIKNGIVAIDDDGIIVEIINPKTSNIQHPTSNIHKHKGIICPGFINAHCHLELSHLKNKISEKTGLPQFIKDFQNIRKSNNGNTYEAIEKAENEMLKNGIVGVGDISNTNDSFSQKEKNNLRCHTFLELFSFNPDKANETFDRALKLMKSVPRISSPSGRSGGASIVPHSPYSVSEKLVRKIAKYNFQNAGLMSIHNQETRDENLLFQNKKGKIAEMLKHFGNDLSKWKHSKKTSLQTIFPYFFPLNKKSKILFVHNTFTTKKDLDFLKSEIANPKSEIYFCFCPNANLYIENRLPDFQLFIDANFKITVGTDSLASNWNLSILEELKTISKNSPQIPLNTLLTWATKNGADFFGWNDFGTIEKRKKCGLNLIQNVDLKNLKLRNESSIIKLL